MESIESLNARLVDHYGVDTSNNLPLFRVVWSDDQFEKRLVPITDLGVHLLYPEIREVRKYPYIPHLYVLERLVAVPESQIEELAGEKLSYEPIWAFKDAQNNPLPPIWTVCKIVVDILYAALGKKSLFKYVDPDSPENKEIRISQLQEELFGNETETGDALAYKQAIVVPQTYEKGE